MAIGGAAAALVGYAALRLLIRLVRGGRLAWFALYLLPLAVLVGLLAVLR